MKYFLGAELRFWDLLGERISISLRLYLRVLAHKRSMLFIFLCMVALIAADPSGAQSYVPFWLAFVFWPVLFAFYLAITTSLVLLVAAVSRLIPNLRVPLPILGFVTLIPTVALCETGLHFASNGTIEPDFLGKFLSFFFMIQGVETVYFRFILPEIRNDLDAEEPSRHLVVGGEKVELTKLLHIEAREHHVHLTFENETSVARARLGDIVAQTQTEDGMQPHRSWWVARDPAIRAERKNGRLVLRLRDDTEVPVARTRTDDVIAWLQTHVNPAE
ncbi:LytTR family DNA-binding domain-containing protein [Marivita sp.]|uniref:LytTR family DNA-binding domain-containing protein n=1 Tax=Marivita sp. TaxID=2003365 RepID=UPI0026284E81|nr:LytTR family DNA-binding domain-containing protein [Marivita sp.]